MESSIEGITGATPKRGFKKEWGVPPNLPFGTYLLKAEINHSKDFNDFYHEGASPSDFAYSGGKMGAGQPSVVYAGKIKISDKPMTTVLEKIGHGHPAGKTGDLYPDLKNLDTALEIVKSIQVTYQPGQP